VGVDSKNKVVIQSGNLLFCLMMKGNIPPKGTAVTFIVRADKIDMKSPGHTKVEEYENTLPATIIGQEYIGTIIKFTLRCETGAFIKVLLPVGYYQGENEVTLSWDSVNTHVLPWGD
jgi:hypothetical protein